ncbi:MAG: efflux RND transporter periplasmic adaptor subunit [Parvibaculum sp.]|nr:efflux RND transporter periplasmic adaptor subunit [Parvibaculum sp.]
MVLSRGFGAFALIGLTLIPLSGCGPSESQDADAAKVPAIPVLVSTVTIAPGAEDVSAYGIIRSDKEAGLSFKIAGLIKTLDADTGDQVKKGQVLARLDQREIDAQSARAEANAAKARRDLARIEPLLKNGFISQQRIDDARSAAAVANAELRQIEFNRSLATITAPSDGVVLSRHADRNEIVAAGAPVLTVSQGAAGFIFKAALSDSAVAKLKVGDTAEIRLDAFKDQPVKGHVRRLSAMSDAQTGTFGVEIMLDETPSGVESGFIGKVRIAPSDTADETTTLAIPASAILEGHGATATVYVVNEKDMTAHLTRVTLGGLQDDHVLVTKGLKAGDKVVSAGAPYLRDGVGVEIVTDLAVRAAKPEPRS